MGKGDMLQEMANMSNINKTVSFVIQHAGEIWDDTQYEPYGASSSNSTGHPKQQQEEGRDYADERGAAGNGDNDAGDGSVEREMDAPGSGPFDVPKLGPLPFMVPPLRRQRGGGRVSDTGGSSELGASVAEVLSSPNSPVHIHYPANSGAGRGLDIDTSGRGAAAGDDTDDGMALSQSMPSPKGMFFNAGLPLEQHGGQQAAGGHNSGLLVYSQQQTGYGNNTNVAGGSNIHSRGSFDVPRNKK
ncbi:hypothetical protein GGI23_007843 [Coemansia sp. RSA 2559]|nr:hypothetical protein GGI23_007843 [Coemansia sp. RSA 2559]KAJ2855074.1 hypothetical protein GGI22_004267 [Coemansia erecta]